MRQTLGLFVARALEGSWRREPPFLELSKHELGDIATLLATSGAGALAWSRISRIPYLRDQPEASILKKGSGSPLRQMLVQA